MILHTINKPPLSSSCFAECLSVCSDNDSILLIEDGVYAAVSLSEIISAQGKLPENLFALRADIETRGLTGRIDSRISIVDDGDFVSLAASHDKVISWY